MRALTTILILVMAAAIVIGGFEISHARASERNAASLTGGDPRSGRELVVHYGCIACHVVPGFPGTKSHVGPPLDGIGSRQFVAGVTENQPDHLMQFLRDPRSLVPNSAMPNLHISDRDARDLAAFLYTLQ